jgi:hypothetical protein
MFLEIDLLPFLTCGSLIRENTYIVSFYEFNGSLSVNRFLEEALKQKIVNDEQQKGALNSIRFIYLPSIQVITSESRYPSSTKPTC